MKKYIFYSYVVFLYVLLSGWPSFAHEWVNVKWVNDGDTIVLADGRNVRYIGINSPEIDHGTQKAKPYGYKAKNYNKKFQHFAALAHQEGCSIRNTQLMFFRHVYSQKMDSITDTANEVMLH